MALTFLPSLQHLAFVQIALIVYNDDIIRLFDEMLRIDATSKLDYLFNISAELERWMRKTKKKARKKLSKLLPTSFKDHIAYLLQPLVDEFYFWTRDHWDIFKHIAGSHCTNSLCWKSEGTIDRIKTAKKLVRNENVDKRFRFVIACIYFRENDVRHLWKNMTANERESIFHKKYNIAVKFWVRLLGENVESPWTQHISKYLDEIDTENMDTENMDTENMDTENMDTENIDTENIDTENIDTENIVSRVRVSSFFTELNILSKELSIHRLWPEFSHSDDLRLCYRLFNEAERAEAFLWYLHSKIVDVLCCYLDWPLQSLFLDVVNQVSSLLTFRCIEVVLYYIVEGKLMRGMRDFDYLQLLKDFWIWIPDIYKTEYRRDGRIIFTLVRAVLSYDEETHPLPIEKLLKKCKAFIFTLPSELFYCSDSDSEISDPSDPERELSS